MKTAVSLLLAFAALSMQGCTKDPIDIVLPDDNTETPVNADDSAGAGIETDKDDDNVANTTFARTVKVIFNGGSATVSGATADFADVFVEVTVLEFLFVDLVVDASLEVFDVLWETIGVHVLIVLTEVAVHRTLDVSSPEEVENEETNEADTASDEGN